MNNFTMLLPGLILISFLQLGLGREFREFLADEHPVKVVSLEPPPENWQIVQASTHSFKMAGTKLTVFFFKYVGMVMNKIQYKGYLELHFPYEDTKVPQDLQPAELSVQDFEASVFHAINIFKRKNGSEYDFYVELFMVNSCKAKIFTYFERRHSPLRYQSSDAICGKGEDFEEGKYQE